MPDPRILRMEADPRFASLPYSDQIEVRFRKYQEILGKDQRFSSLPDADKVEVLQKLSFRPPVFENPSLFAETIELAKRIEGGDEGARRLALASASFASTALQETPILKFLAQKFSIPLANLIGPSTKGMKAGDYTNEILWSSDARKAREYLTTVLSQDERSNRMQGILQTAGKILGTGMDYFTLTPGMSLIGGLARGGASKIAASSASRFVQSRAGQYLVKKGLSQAIESAATGPIEVARTALKAAFPEGGSEKVDANAASLARSFGVGAAYDYLFNMAGSVLGTGLKAGAKNLGKVIKGYKSGSVAVQAAKEAAEAGVEGAAEGWESLLRNVASGRDIPPQALEQAPLHVQDKISHIRTLDSILSKTDTVVPGGKASAYLNAWNMGYTLREVPEGFRLTSIAEPSEVLTLKTLEDLNKNLSEKFLESIKDLDSLGKAGAVNPLNVHLLSMRGPAKYLDEVFSPELRPAKDLPDDLRLLQQKAQRGKFVPLAYRQQGLASELDRAVERFQADGGVAKRVHLDLDPQAEDALKSGRRIEDLHSKPVDLNDSTSPNAVIFAKSTASVDEASRVMAMASRNGVPADDALRAAGFDSVALNPQGTQIRILHPEGIKILSDSIDPLSGKWIGKPSVEKAASNQIQFGDRLFITNRMKVKLPTDSISGNEEALSTILASGLQGGGIDTGRVRRFAQVFLSKFDVKIRDVNDIVVKRGERETGFVFRLDRQGDRLILNLPAKLPTPEAEKQFVTSLIDQLSDFGKSKGKAPKVETSGESFAEVYKKTLRERKVYTTMWGSEEVASKWVSKIAKEQLNASIIRNPSGMLEVKSGEKSFGTFSSFEEMADTILKNTMSASELSRIASASGYRLIPKGEGKYALYGQIGKGKGSVIEASSLPELIEKSGLEMKVPSKYMPRAVYVNDGVTTLDYNGEVAFTKDTGQAYRLLDRFEERTVGKIKTILRSDKGTVYKSVDSSSFRVYDDRIGHWFEADSLSEAKRILEDSIQDQSLLAQIAHEKGISVDASGTGYHVVADGNYYFAKSKEELQEILKNRPLPKEMPELVDLGHELDDILPKMNVPEMGTFKPVDYMRSTEPRSDLSILRRINAFWQPMDVNIPEISRVTGHEGVLKNFRELETGRRLARRDSNEVQNILRSIFSSGSGNKRKVIPLARRQAVFNYMKAIEEGLEANDLARVSAEFKITPEEESMVDQARTILGRDSAHGLYAKFREGGSFIFDYLPRLKKEIAKMSKAELESLSHLDIASKAFGGRSKVPKSVEFWAAHERLNELLSIAVDDDIYSVLSKYNVIGHKRLYMNEAWEGMKGYFKEQGKNMPPILRANIQTYMEGVMGIPPSVSAKEVQRIGQDMWTRLHMNKPGDGAIQKDVLSTMFSLNYMTTMGWRPWLWFRNMFQIYTTLAPRFGNQFTHAAVRKAADIGEQVYQHLEQIGVVLSKEDLPVFGEIAGQETKLGKLTRRGLSRYKNSDDFSRVVAYLSTKEQWDDAVGALQRKVIDGDQFVERSGLNLIEPDVRNQVLSLAQEGKWDAALDTYALRVIEDTMFPYRGELRPRVYATSVVGRIFGRYGTYSPYYVSNLIKGFKYGTKGQKAAFAARWIANSLAIYGAAQAVGIQAKEFLPWTPMFFSGGPEFNLMIDALRATGSGPEAQEKRAALLRDLPRNFVPGFYQARSISRFMELMDQGEPIRAMFALSGAPIKP